MIFLTLMGIVIYFLLPIFLLERLIEKKTDWSGDRTMVVLALVLFVELAFFCQIVYWLGIY